MSLNDDVSKTSIIIIHKPDFVLTALKTVKAEWQIIRMEYMQEATELMLEHIHPATSKW